MFLSVFGVEVLKVKNVLQGEGRVNVEQSLSSVAGISDDFFVLPLDVYKGVIEFLKGLAFHRRRLAEFLRGRLRVGQVKDFNCSGVFGGVDAGVNGLDLVSGFFPVVKAVGAVFDGFKLIRDPLLVSSFNEVFWVDERFPKLRAGLLGFNYQFKLARELIERFEPDYLFFDGPLLINKVYYPNRLGSSREYKDLFSETVKEAVSLINLCRDRGVKLVGFVKRSRSVHFSRSLHSVSLFLNGLSYEIVLRDVSLLNCMLKQGEFTYPFKLKGLIDRVYREASRQNGGSIGIYAFYVKTSGSRVYRVEVPKFLVRKTREIASTIMGLRDPLTGVPFPIYEVDALTKVSRDSVALQYISLYSKLIKEVENGDFNLDDLDLLDVQFGEDLQKVKIGDGANRKSFVRFNR